MASLPIGHRVRSRRKELGLTQTELARNLGISVSYVNLIEHDKRSIGGGLLNRMTTALSLEPGALDGTAERRMLQELGEITAEPYLSGLKLGDDSARDLISRHEGWAQALIAMRRTLARDRSLIAALSDRLNHDPVLNQSTHDMLSSAAAIRSVADILVETENIESDQRTRFDRILQEEAARLSEVAQSLAGTFEQSELRLAGGSASEEVDDFIYANRNYFPVLETLAEDIVRSMGTDTAALTERLEKNGVEIRYFDISAEDASFPGHWSHFDRRRKRLDLLTGTPGPTHRFALAKALAEIEGEDAISSVTTSADLLTSAASVELAKNALKSYVAAAIVLPYAPFHEKAELLRYDIDALSLYFGASPEQLCHRFTSLGRPGAEGVPFAMVRANIAGYLTKRFPLPRLPIPRYRGACPIWAVYVAAQTPDLRIRQVAEFPNGEKYLFIARATRPGFSAFGRSRPAFTLMLGCDISYSDRLVYADGLDLSSPSIADQVGSTCAMCPREGCLHRQEARTALTP